MYTLILLITKYLFLNLWAGGHQSSLVWLKPSLLTYIHMCMKIRILCCGYGSSVQSGGKEPIYQDHVHWLG